MNSAITYGPEFEWFAWRPVWTDDRGWRWLRKVRRRRCFYALIGQPAVAIWVHAVGD